MQAPNNRQKVLQLTCLRLVRLLRLHLMVEDEAKTCIAVVRSDMFPNRCIRFLRIWTLRKARRIFLYTDRLRQIKIVDNESCQLQLVNMRVKNGRAPRSLDVLQASPEHHADPGSAPARWEEGEGALQQTGTSQRPRCLLR